MYVCMTYTHILSLFFLLHITRLKEMGAKISHDYAGKEILAVGLLTGCIMFQINLLKYLTVPYQIDFIQVQQAPHRTEAP